jgi:hypothetical protein
VIPVLLGLSGLILALTVGFGFVELPKSGRLVGNNSLAISAACHAPQDDTDAAFLPVKWGAVGHESENKPGHCCLTSPKVEALRDGDWYE